MKTITKDEFEKEVLKSPIPVILDFYSEDCDPCNALFPKLEELEPKLKNKVHIYKIFRQGNREFSVSLGVTSSPTLLFFNKGKEFGRRLNGWDITKNDILEVLTEYVDVHALMDLKEKRKETKCSNGVCEL